MEKVAFFGGSFDPPHRGHITIAHALTRTFGLDRFVFVPAHQAPHKRDRLPTSPFHRFAMLAIATAKEPDIRVSAIEMESPDKPYTYETLTRLSEENPETRIFFVIGADSWNDITSWREWESVLTMVDIIIVTRPGYEVSSDHVTEEIRERIVDLRPEGTTFEELDPGAGIFVTDAVNMGISATEIRGSIKRGEASWKSLVIEEVANYIEKYQIYS